MVLLRNRKRVVSLLLVTILPKHEPIWMGILDPALRVAAGYTIEKRRWVSTTTAKESKPVAD